MDTNALRMRGLAAFVALGTFAGATKAGYIMTPTINGSANGTVQFGETFTVDIELSGDPGDAHNSSLFRLLFTAPGIEYLGYSWSAPYQDQSIFDFSQPLWNALPATITPGLVPGPNSVSDIELSNVVPAGTFGSGTLVTLTLRVPSDWSGPDSLFIVPHPDTFANGFTVVPAVAGEALTLNIIVPGPGSAALFMIATAFCVSPRRR